MEETKPDTILPEQESVGTKEKLGLWERFQKNEKIPLWFRSVPWPLVGGVIFWWVLNCVYVIQNKVFLNAIPLHWTSSGMQLILGAVLCGIGWATKFREIPRFTNWRKALMVFVPLGICHLMVHYGAVISMGLGAISFAQVVKASEPVVTSLLSIIFLREFLNVWAYLCLIPVVVGVSLASVKELDFNIWAFLFAMLSNVGSSSRAILAKVTMKNKEEIGENLTAPNIYMILTVVSGALSIPLVLITEAGKWKEVWTTSTAAMTSHEKGMYIFRAFIAALCYCIYNDFAFYCLGQMNQVTHSMTNTLKRVLVIVVSIMIFRNPVTLLGGIGMAMAVTGGCLYSLAKQGLCTPKKDKGDIEKQLSDSMTKDEKSA